MATSFRNSDAALLTPPAPPSPPPADPHRQPALVPPYWQRRRAASTASVVSSNGRPPAITLEDNTEHAEGSVRSPLWAKVVTIESYTVVSGNIKGLGDYVVWICNVQTLDGGCMVIRKRYSEFETLRQQLCSTFPKSGSSLPHLPPKSVLYKFRPSFLEKRRTKLEYFMNCTLLNPEFSGSAIMKEFVFS